MLCGSGVESTTGTKTLLTPDGTWKFGNFNEPDLGDLLDYQLCDSIAARDYDRCCRIRVKTDNRNLSPKSSVDSSRRIQYGES